MIKLMKRQFPILLSVLLLGNAFAQEEELPLEEEEEIVRYTVEMIIFTYNEDVSIGSEVFIPDAPPPQEQVFDEMGLESGEPIVFGDFVDSDIAEEVVEEEPLLEVDLNVRRMYEFVMLKEEELTLDETYGHLERLDVYEPVLHFGWTERPLPKEESKVRPLSSFVTPPEELGLEGDLQLYLGRFLHLVVNLQLDAPSETSAETVYNFGDYSYSDADGGRFDEFGIVVEQPVHYRINEDRIFKRGDIRYFDHPKFGVLAKITRWEEQEPEELNEEFLGDAELLGFDGQ